MNGSDDKGMSFMFGSIRQFFVVSVLLSTAFLSRDTGVTAASNTSPNPDKLVGRALRGLVDGFRHGLLMQAADRSAIDAFYRQRGFSPVWIVDGRMTDRARAIIKCLAEAEAEGLRSVDYAVPKLENDLDVKAAARTELGLTTAALAYAHDAAVGRIPYNKISSEIAYPSQPFNRAAALLSLTKAENPAEILVSFNPAQAGFQALKKQLAEYRAALDEARNLKFRSRGAAVERSRLETVIRTIVANMERWRWMPRDLGGNHVIVNIPDFTLKVVREGSIVWKTKIIVGDPLLPTPVMSADMTSVTFNPIWNVPKSIAEKEYLTAIDDELERLDRLGIRSVRYADGSVHVYQLPGEWNALGQVRFNFPNKFAVYQHDTPEQFLFERKVRTFSHGCMRVEKPLIYAQVLLAIAAPESEYSDERIYGLLGGDQVNIKLPKPIPVHLTYQTAFVDDAGNLQLRQDIYGHDQRLLAELLRAPVVVAIDAADSSEKLLRATTTNLFARMVNWLDRQKHRFGVQG